MRCLLGCLLSAGLVFCTFAAAPPPGVRAEVRKLIDQLGDDGCSHGNSVKTGGL